MNVRGKQFPQQSSTAPSSAVINLTRNTTAAATTTTTRSHHGAASHPCRRTTVTVLMLVIAAGLAVIVTISAGSLKGPHGGGSAGAGLSAYHNYLPDPNVVHEALGKVNYDSISQIIFGSGGSGGGGSDGNAASSALSKPIATKEKGPPPLATQGDILHYRSSAEQQRKRDKMHREETASAAPSPNSGDGPQKLIEGNPSQIDRNDTSRHQELPFVHPCSRARRPHPHPLYAAQGLRKLPTCMMPALNDPRPTSRRKWEGEGAAGQLPELHLTFPFSTTFFRPPYYGQPGLALDGSMPWESLWARYDEAEWAQYCEAVARDGDAVGGPSAPHEGAPGHHHHYPFDPRNGRIVVPDKVVFGIIQDRGDWEEMMVKGQLTPPLFAMDRRHSLRQFQDDEGNDGSDEANNGNTEKNSNEQRTRERKRRFVGDDDGLTTTHPNPIVFTFLLRIDAEYREPKKIVADFAATISCLREHLLLWYDLATVDKLFNNHIQTQGFAMLSDRLGNADALRPFFDAYEGVRLGQWPVVADKEVEEMWDQIIDLYRREQWEKEEANLTGSTATKNDNMTSGDGGVLRATERRLLVASIHSEEDRKAPRARSSLFHSGGRSLDGSFIPLPPRSPEIISLAIDGKVLRNHRDQHGHLHGPDGRPLEGEGSPQHEQEREARELLERQRARLRQHDPALPGGHQPALPPPAASPDRPPSPKDALYGKLRDGGGLEVDKRGSGKYYALECVSMSMSEEEEEEQSNGKEKGEVHVDQPQQAARELNSRHDDGGEKRPRKRRPSKGSAAVQPMIIDEEDMIPIEVFLDPKSVPWRSNDGTGRHSRGHHNAAHYLRMDAQVVDMVREKATIRFENELKPSNAAAVTGDALAKPLAAGLAEAEDHTEDNPFLFTLPGEDESASASNIFTTVLLHPPPTVDLQKAIEASVCGRLFIRSKKVFASSAADGAGGANDGTAGGNSSSSSSPTVTLTPYFELGRFKTRLLLPTTAGTFLTRISTAADLPSVLGGGGGDTDGRTKREDASSAPLSPITGVSAAGEAAILSSTFTAPYSFPTYSSVIPPDNDAIAPEITGIASSSSSRVPTFILPRLRTIMGTSDEHAGAHRHSAILAEWVWNGRKEAHYYISPPSALSAGGHIGGGGESGGATPPAEAQAGHTEEEEEHPSRRRQREATERTRSLALRRRPNTGRAYIRQYSYMRVRDLSDHHRQAIDHVMLGFRLFRQGIMTVERILGDYPVAATSATNEEGAVRGGDGRGERNGAAGGDVAVRAWGGKAYRDGDNKKEEKRRGTPDNRGGGGYTSEGDPRPNGPNERARHSVPVAELPSSLTTGGNSANTDGAGRSSSSVDGDDDHRRRPPSSFDFPSTSLRQSLPLLLASRPYLWSFFGDMKSDRPLMRSTFEELTRAVQEGHHNKNGKFRPFLELATPPPEKRWWLERQRGQGRDQPPRGGGEDDSSHLRDHKCCSSSNLEMDYKKAMFVPIGRGFETLDCFRIYEGLGAGALPVIVGDIDELVRTFGSFVGAGPGEETKKAAERGRFRENRNKNVLHGAEGQGGGRGGQSATAANERNNLNSSNRSARIGEATYDSVSTTIMSASPYANTYLSVPGMGGPFGDLSVDLAAFDHPTEEFLQYAERLPPFLYAPSWEAAARLIQRIIAGEEAPPPRGRRAEGSEEEKEKEGDTGGLLDGPVRGGENSQSAATSAPPRLTDEDDATTLKTMAAANAIQRLEDRRLRAVLWFMRQYWFMQERLVFGAPMEAEAPVTGDTTARRF